MSALSVEAGRRLLVHGPNGAGKTTLLRLLAGELRPDAGTVRLRARIGHLPQEAHFPDPARTLLAAFAADRRGTPGELREQLMALGLFPAEALTTQVGRLSVGQRRRLALARLLTAEAELLLLDEPTNHFSPALVEEFDRALASYTGAVVLVSHDRALRERFAGERVRISEGALV